MFCSLATSCVLVLPSMTRRSHFWNEEEGVLLLTAHPEIDGLRGPAHRERNGSDTKQKEHQ